MKKQVKPDLANGLKVLALLCDRLPSAATPDEQELWHFVHAFDENDSIPLQGLPPAPRPWKSLAAFEAYVKTACKVDLTTNPTWRRLMSPENVAARREQIRMVDQSLDLVFGPKKEGATNGNRSR